MASLRRALGAALAGLLAVWAGLACAGAVMGAAGRWAPSLDVLSHLAPLYGVVAALTALSAAFLRTSLRPVVLALSAVGLLASAVLVVPEFLRPGGPQAPPDAPGQIKIIQFNARRSNTDIRQVARWLIAQDADVITISEARRDLRDLLLAHGWNVAGARSDLMIFTPRRYDRMNRPKGDWSVTFINATYTYPSGALEAVTTHVDWPTEPVVTRQLSDIESIAGRLPRHRMILTGDFNATPWSAEMRRLDTRLGLIRRDRAVATWPAQAFGRPWPLPLLPIDHVYAGPGWATVKVERGPWLGSDHYPVIVTLAPVAPR